eukprot:1475119-Rhodomonas_salina.2
MRLLGPSSPVRVRSRGEGFGVSVCGVWSRAGTELQLRQHTHNRNTIASRPLNSRERLVSESGASTLRKEERGEVRGECCKLAEVTRERKPHHVQQAVPDPLGFRVDVDARVGVGGGVGVHVGGGVDVDVAVGLGVGSVVPAGDKLWRAVARRQRSGCAEARSREEQS